MEKPDLSVIPDKPGVYLYKDSKNRIVYVGKALSLRKRITSYFDSSHKSIKTHHMLQSARNLDYIITANEVEALLLEANLIKTEKPKYNILLKDSKGYPYIKITKEIFPRVMFTRDTSDDNAEYFGPFVDANNLRGILKSILKVFPLRSCSNSRFKQGKTCINYQIKRCKGPCAGLINDREYHKLVCEIKDFFRGNISKLEETLDAEMKRYAAYLMFEEAAETRDRLNALGKLFTNQKVVLPVEKHIDSFVFGKHKEIDFVTMSFIRNGKLIGLSTKIIDNQKQDDDCLTFIAQFYSVVRQFPEEIFISPVLEKEKSTLLESAISKLSGKRISIRQKGFKQLVALAENNGVSHVEKYLQNRDTGIQMMDRLSRVLFLKKPPETVQCVDISHLSGDMTIGASVYWKKDIGFVKKYYRKYNIRNVDNDDVKAIYQVMSRKAENIIDGSEQNSDLYIIDGGKGQLNAAVKAFEEKGLSANLCSISKGRSKNDEKFKQAESIEEIHLPGRKNPVKLKRNDKALLFAANIRDEAHRFVISALRQKALKGYRKSPLLQIEGLGEKRLKALLTEFPDIYSRDDITAESIKNHCSIPADVCRRIVEFVKEYRKQN